MSVCKKDVSSEIDCVELRLQGECKCMQAMSDARSGGHRSLGRYAVTLGGQLK